MRWSGPPQRTSTIAGGSGFKDVERRDPLGKEDNVRKWERVAEDRTARPSADASTGLFLRRDSREAAAAGFRRRRVRLRRAARATARRGVAALGRRAAARTMRWMGRSARRGDPGRPGARTVISAAAGYYGGTAGAASGDGATRRRGPPGRTLRGGSPVRLGGDYHRRISGSSAWGALTAPRLSASWTTVWETRPSSTARVYRTRRRGDGSGRTRTDPEGAPVRCVLGKHRDGHSAPARRPRARNYCGTCARCTPSPHRRDRRPHRPEQAAGKAASGYLTIEHAGSIPIASPSIGPGSFGCDDARRSVPGTASRPVGRPWDFAARGGPSAPADPHSSISMTRLQRFGNRVLHGWNASVRRRHAGTPTISAFVPGPVRHGRSRPRRPRARRAGRGPHRGSARGPAAVSRREPRGRAPSRAWRARENRHPHRAASAARERLEACRLLNA